MSGQFGVQSLCKVTDLLIETGNITGEALVDGKIEISDAALLLKLYDEFVALGGVTWSDIPKELNDMDQNDAIDYIDHIKTKFNIPQDKVEGIVEDCLDAVSSAVMLGFKVKNIIDKIKSA